MAGGGKMKTSDSCPLDGSWMRASCTTYQNQKNSGTLANCQHRDRCANARKLVESDINESVAVSKRVLIEHIPQIFEVKP